MDRRIHPPHVEGIPGASIFLAVGDSLLAGVERGSPSVQLTEELLCHTALLRNESSVPLVFFVIVWKFISLDGLRSRYVRVYRERVPGGSERLVDSLGRASSVSTALFGQPPYAMAARHTRLTLDAVLFEDGSFAGPGMSGVLDDLLFQYRLYGSVIRGHDAGASELAMFLEAHSAAALSGGGHALFRRRLAETLLREHENQGLEAAILLAKRSLADLPPCDLRKLLG